MQRIREQKQCRSQIRTFCREHRRLAAAIRMPAHKYGPGYYGAECCGSIRDSLAIPLGRSGEWRALGPILAEREVVSQNHVTGIVECMRQPREQRSLAV